MTYFPETLYEKVVTLKNMIATHVTGGKVEEADFLQLRLELLSDPDLRERLPRWLKTHRTLMDFWNLVKPRFEHYRERREFLRNEFEPVLSYLELGQKSPVEGLVGDGLKALEVDHLHEQWEKALGRRASDPQGAITTARTLIESTCKCILDEQGIPHSNEELPKLYSMVASSLHLAPNQQTEQTFKQILGHCHAIVDGLASLRNKLSDAHGQGKDAVKPASRHSELAVNLAGTMAVFLAAAFHEKKRIGEPL